VCSAAAAVAESRAKSRINFYYGKKRGRFARGGPATAADFFFGALFSQRR